MNPNIGLKKKMNSWENKDTQIHLLLLSTAWKAEKMFTFGDNHNKMNGTWTLGMGTFWNVRHLEREPFEIHSWLNTTLSPYKRPFKCDSMNECLLCAFESKICLLRMSLQFPFVVRQTYNKNLSINFKFVPTSGEVIIV